jgi:ribose-phosphate pyrophosphokinase
MQCAGIDHVMLLDVYAPQIEGFFRGPVDHLTAVPVLCDAVRHHIETNTVVVSPDAGRVASATEYARRLGVPLAVLHKRRESGDDTTVTHVVGDVANHSCLIIDDMISTGGTIVESVHALRRAGACDGFLVAATHGVFVDDACTRLADAGVAQVFVTDSIAAPERRCSLARVVTIAPLIADSIRRAPVTVPS